MRLLELLLALAWLPTLPTSSLENVKVVLLTKSFVVYSTRTLGFCHCLVAIVCLIGLKRAQGCAAHWGVCLDCRSGWSTHQVCNLCR